MGGTGGTAAGSGAPSSGGVPSGGNATGGGGTGGGATGGNATGGTTGGNATGGNATGGNATGGTTGGNATGGNITGGAGAGGTTGGNATGGNATGGNATGGTTGGNASGGNATGGNATGGTTGGNATGGNATGGNATGGAGAGGSGGSSGAASGGAPTAPDCNAAMPSGPQQHNGNGTGGEGNLGWEIWSNTGQGQLTTYSVPAFIATWNNAGGYLGRLGFEWGGFGDDPVPHTQVGTITAQFASRKTGSAGGYSYVGMYGWTTNPCVEWYIVDDSYNNMPINPGGTTNEGEVMIDGGTYIMYTRPTTGTGGSRCASSITNWIQYYSVRRTARACGVISLSEHFNAWQSLGMDMTGELLEAKILVEVGGGVGNVELPVANVVVQ